MQWFTDESARTSDDPAYLEHNRSFVLADAYLAAAALLAAKQLWKGQPSAVPLGVATGSAMTFLGLLDLLYDLQHGTFSDRSSAARLEASIVGSALVLGPATMVRLWKARARLAA